MMRDRIRNRLIGLVGAIILILALGLARGCQLGWL